VTPERCAIVIISVKKTFYSFCEKICERGLVINIRKFHIFWCENNMNLANCSIYKTVCMTNLQNNFGFYYQKSCQKSSC